MKLKKKFGDIIYLEWIDACEISGWKSFEDAIKIPNEVHVRTRGFFLNQTKEFVIIAHSIGKSKQNDICGVMHIPLAWIKKWR